jgi:hypothetical protein
LQSSGDISQNFEENDDNNYATLKFFLLNFSGTDLKPDTDSKHILIMINFNSEKKGWKIRRDSLYQTLPFRPGRALHIATYTM